MPALPIKPLIQNGRITLHPAPDVVQRQTALRRHFFQVAIAQRVPQIPPKMPNSGLFWILCSPPMRATKPHGTVLSTDIAGRSLRSPKRPPFVAVIVAAPAASIVTDTPAVPEASVKELEALRVAEPDATAKVTVIPDRPAPARPVSCTLMASGRTYPAREVAEGVEAGPIDRPAAVALFDRVPIRRRVSVADLRHSPVATYGSWNATLRSRFSCRVSARSMEPSGASFSSCCCVT